ncbi:sigma-E factor negative regulatory protein [Gammaproteobacteria bacterium]|nr:sigma-E factor negative regulatory protein [Gammaproteobacteria bacterium]
MKNNDINENLSALYDGELDESEINSVLDTLSSDKSLQKKLSNYALMSSALNKNEGNIQPIKSKNRLNPNFWLSNGITAAASVLLTIAFVNFDTINFSRLGPDNEAANRLSLAINSKEAKDIASLSQENLVDHVLKVINNPEFMSSNNSDIDLRNVGFNINGQTSSQYIKGNESFRLRLEKKNLGINKVRYWKHGNKMIYLVPLADGRVLTLYGNLNSESAIKIAQVIDQ